MRSACRETSSVRARVRRHARRRRWLSVLAVGLAAIVAVGVADAGTVPVTETFYCTGGPQTFTVPTGVSSVTLEAIGAPGGSGYGGASGGGGAQGRRQSRAYG